MPGLLIANIAAPLLVSQTGNIFIFVSILPVETLVLWLFFKLALKNLVSLPRLLIVVLVANIATSILSIPLIYNNLIASSPVVILLVLPISFILSLFVESVIYIPFLRNKHQIKVSSIILAAFLSNLASYTVFIFVLLPISFSFNSFSTGNPARTRFEIRIPFNIYIRAQEAFYLEKSRFASTASELELGNLESSKSKLYEYKIQSDSSKASLTASAKLDDLRSYRATIFVMKDASKLSAPKFISRVCETNEQLKQPPELPQVINNKFQCPSGSSEISLKRF